MLGLGERGRLCVTPQTALGRTGHHGGDGDGSRYMGRARKKEKKRMNPWCLQQEQRHSGTQTRLESGLLEAPGFPDEHA